MERHADFGYERAQILMPRKILMPATRPPQHCLLVIPARRRSTRLPDKLLLREPARRSWSTLSKPLPGWPDGVVIATDDAEIATEARRFAARVVMTSPDCPSGTDRVAEAVRHFDEPESS